MNEKITSEDLNRLSVEAQDAITALNSALKLSGRHFNYGPDADSREALREALVQVACASGEIDDFDDFDPCDMFDDSRHDPDL